MGEWNVMDYGSYLNDGKTPPYYSAYDRFYLGWLQPVELIGSQYVSLEPLHQSNKAYLITPEGNHNLIGNNPDPTEFFVLENRQNEGWDTYLPGHGLLISRINYNRYLWENNCVNNASTTMGFNIMAADKKWGESTMSGDPFPGTSGVNYYVPELRNKSLLENKRIHVQEKDGKIYLQYLEADGLLIPLAEEATDVTSSSLTANWQSVNDADAYRITLFSVTEGTSYYNQNFDAGFSGLTEWYRTFETTTTDENLCGETAPAALFTRMGDILQTENFFVPVAELSFHLKPASEANSELVLSGWNGETWKTVKTILVNSRSEGVQKMEFGLEQNYIQLRFEQTNTEGGFAVDDIAVVLHKKLNFQTENKLVYGNAETFTGLYPDLNYHYVVKAVKNEEGAEIVSLNSNKITANTAKDNNKNNKIRVIQAVGGVLELYVSSEYMGKPLYVYSTSGQLVKHISNITSNFTVIDHLPRQRMYIVKVGSSRVKLVML